MTIVCPIVILSKVKTLKKNAKYNDIEGMVYRMQLIYDEIIDILE